jgi:APA family basic amino acid/polyamine antiporter
MSEQGATSDSRLLTLPMAICLVLGNMVGSGIFLLPATLAPFGGVSMLGWLFTGSGALLLALTFAWLARTRAVAGGIYAYTRLAFGEPAGFLVAWSYWISIWVSVAALATAVVSYLSALVPALALSPALAAITALSMLWILTAVNLRGVRSAGAMQLTTCVLKISPLFLLMVMGAWFIEPANFVPFNPTGQPLMQATGAAATLALWALLGLESAAVASARVHQPVRNVARATLIGTALAALVTATVCTVAMGIVPPEQLAKSNAPMADVAAVVWGGSGAAIMAVTGAVSAFGALNGWILLQGQLPQAMARDGLFPAIAGTENAHGVPAFALILGSVMASIMIVLNYSGPLVRVFTFLTLLATLATLVPYLFATMAAFRLLGRDGPVPLTRWRAVLLLAAFSYALWMMQGSGLETVLWGLVLLLSGLPVYFWLRHANRKSGLTPQPTVSG